MTVDDREVSLHVDWDRYDASIHSALDCITCHYELDGVETFPHARDLERVACTDCHDDDSGPIDDWRNSTHGRLAEEGDPLAPICQDCHGGHYVLPLEDPTRQLIPLEVAVAVTDERVLIGVSADDLSGAGGQDAVGWIFLTR